VVGVTTLVAHWLANLSKGLTLHFPVFLQAKHFQAQQFSRPPLMYDDELVEQFLVDCPFSPYSIWCTIGEMSFWAVVYMTKISFSTFSEDLVVN
jgi:hypothetical protein